MQDLKDSKVARATGIATIAIPASADPAPVSVAEDRVIAAAAGERPGAGASA